MKTLLFGVLTFLLVLGPLVILHELGHLVVAKLSRVKVVEFGFGFPPRLWGLWTGATAVRVPPEMKITGALRDAHGRSLDDTPMSQLAAPGDLVAFVVERTDSGEQVAQQMIDYGERLDRPDSVVAGKVKAVRGDVVDVSEMVWSINLLPIGGFVKMIGEENPTADGSLARKPPLTRAAVLAAGSFVNLILPFFILTAVAMIPQQVPVGNVTITGVMPGSPAAAAGLQSGDVVERVDGHAIRNVSDLQQAVTLKLGSDSAWVIRAPGSNGSQGAEHTVHLVPRWHPPKLAVVSHVTDPATQISLAEARQSDPSVGVSDQLTVVNSVSDPNSQISLAEAQQINAGWQLGTTLTVVSQVTDPANQISLDQARAYNPALGLASSIQEGAAGVTVASDSMTLERQWSTPWDAVATGFTQVRNLVLLTKSGVEGIIVHSSNPQLSGPAAVGPIGIGQLTGEIATAPVGIVAKVTTLANLAAALSLSLAVINILPIPALDGGRLLFVVIEFLRGGKRVSPEREGLVHMAGMVLLLTLITLISIEDILRIIRGGNFF